MSNSNTVAREAVGAEKVGTSLQFPYELWVRVGIQAIRAGLTKTQFVEQAIAEKLDREEPREPRKKAS